VNNNGSAVIGTRDKSSESVETKTDELAVIKTNASGDMAGQKPKIFSGSEKKAEKVVKNKNKSSKQTPVKEINDIELL
jgi:hypothetical protein